MKRWARILGLVLVVVAVGLQMMPRGHRRTNPISSGEPAWDTPRTRELFVRACSDCHSNDTRWPWYSHVAPMSWYVIDHVEEGRARFNVSRWTDAMAEEAREARKEIERGKMPLPSYLWAHREARLSAAEKAELARGLDRTFAVSAGHERGHD
jgi:hypothetical protein